MYSLSLAILKSMDDPFFEEELDFEFELVNSEDGRVITLVCRTSRELFPDEYAQALKAFAERIESVVSMNSEVEKSTLN